MLAGLPEEIEEYIIPPEEKCSICGGEMKVIGKRVIRTEVEFRPAKVIVKQIVQQIAKCTDCGRKRKPQCKEPFPKSRHTGISFISFDCNTITGRTGHVSEICHGPATIQTEE